MFVPVIVQISFWSVPRSDDTHGSVCVLVCVIRISLQRALPENSTPVLPLNLILVDDQSVCAVVVK